MVTTPDPAPTRRPVAHPHRDRGRRPRRPMGIADVVRARDRRRWERLPRLGPFRTFTAPTGARAPASRLDYPRRVTVLGGELAVPCTRNPLQRGW